MNIRHASLLGAILVPVAVAVPACTSEVAVDDRPCPCAAGWTCCESKNACVAAGEACPGGDASSSDAGNVPVVLASNQNTPWTIAIDGENVYWLNAHTLGGVYKVPKAGGTPVALSEGSMGVVHSLGLDATSVYFPLKDSIVAAPIAGGPLRTVASGTNARSVAVVNGELYWIPAAPDLDSKPVANKVSVAGGTPTVIDLPSVPMSAALPGAYFTTAATDAIYASFFVDGMLRLPLDGTVPTFVPGPFASAIGVDDANIYVGARDTLDVMPKTGGTPTHLAPGQNVMGVAVDDAFLYFTEDIPKGRVLKIAKSGGAVTVLAENQGRPHVIAVDATSIYWNCADEGTIKKLAK